MKLSLKLSQNENDHIKSNIMLTYIYAQTTGLGQWLLVKRKIWRVTMIEPLNTNGVKA